MKINHYKRNQKSLIWFGDDSNELIDKIDLDLIYVHVDNWNDDLSPWYFEGVFKNEVMNGNGKKTLEELINYLDPNKKYWIGGYSLAGLFALWASYQSDLFDGVCCCSGSLWYPGMVDYIKSHQYDNPMKVYLSLGKKEIESRNKILREVGNCTEEIYHHLIDSKVNCILEWNEGGHFDNVDKRILKGIEWLKL